MLTWWMWMIVGLVLLVCEVITPGTFFFIFLGISGLLVGLVALLAPDLPAWMHWLLFSVFTGVSLAFFRKPLMEKFKLGKSSHKVDSLVGETCTAVDDIPVSGVGKVEFRGTSWSAQNSGDRPLSRSERCKVERVDGLTLYIRPL